jgi:hypothetical protein
MVGEVLIDGAVRGLVSEGKRVAVIVESTTPDIIGLSISREGLLAMEKLGGGDREQCKPANPEEEIYMRGLSAYGEVMKPPPCFLAAIGLQIPVEAIDMDDELYTAAYCRYVSTIDMIRQGGRQKRLRRLAINSKSPREFVIKWDRVVNRLGGYRRLEMAREAWLAKGAARLASKYQRPLIVIEYERLAGTVRYMDRMDCQYRIIG